MNPPLPCDRDFIICVAVRGFVGEEELAKDGVLRIGEVQGQVGAARDVTLPT